MNPHPTIAAGATFTISVESKNNEPINGYQLGVGFDPAVFEILGTNQGDVKNYSLENFALNKIQQGEFRTVWIDEDTKGVSFAGKKSLFKIYCKAKQKIENIARSIQLDDNVLKTFFYDNRDQAINANLVLNIATEDVKTFLTNVYPNPTSNELSFKFKLTEAAAISIVVRDRNNRTISNSNTYPTGEHTYSFSNTNALTTSTLTYTLSVNNKVLYTGQVIKL